MSAQGIRQKAEAAKLAMELALRMGPEELQHRLAMVSHFSVSSDGHHCPPPGLTFGIAVSTVGDNVAVVYPSRESGQEGPACAVGVFHYPRNFVEMLLGDNQTQQRGRTRRATLLVRSVPASAAHFNDRVRTLRRVVPVGCRSFGTEFMTPLSNIVVPRGDQLHNFHRRELVAWTPLGTALARVKGERTALLDEEPLSLGEVAALVSAAWEGRPIPAAFRGNNRTVLWRAAPFDPGPADGGFEGSGQRFVFFYVEPRLDEKGQALERLLELDADFLLHLELVQDTLSAQLLVRGRDNVSGRAAFLRQQLEDCCDVVKPIKADDDVVRAHWAFQPGGPHYQGFGHFPVTNAPLLINGLTHTISRPQIDGDIFVGIEPGGARWLFELGDAATGGVQHVLLVGKGSSGKTTLMNLLSPQMAGPRIIAFNFNESSLEAFPIHAKKWGPASEPHALEEYADGSGQVKPGIHYLCGDEGREWVAYFVTTQGRDLKTVFREEVVPAACKFVNSLRIPDDLPISMRPLPGCNPALYAAAVSLIWTGIDPWGQNQMVGLKDKWASFAGPEDHLVLRVDDPYRLPEYRPEDADDLASLFGHTVRKMVVFDGTGGFHKDHVHVLMGVQSLDDLENFLPGTLSRFHLALTVGVAEREGVKRHLVWVTDPDKPDEVIAELIGDIQDQALCHLLSRRERAEK